MYMKNVYLHELKKYTSCTYQESLKYAYNQEVLYLPTKEKENCLKKELIEKKIQFCYVNLKMIIMKLKRKKKLK